MRIDDTAELNRRRLLAGAASLGLAGLSGPALGQTPGPWSQPPGGAKPDKLNFVVWTYGNIYERISKQFQADWGIPVDSTISSFNDHPTKLMTMYAAGEKIDVSQSSPFSFPNFVNRASPNRSTACRAPPITPGISPPSPSRSRWWTAS